MGVTKMYKGSQRTCVSVIIPHYNDLSNLDACLTALRQQTDVEQYDIEIIVGDNDSPQGLDEVQKVVGARAKVVHVAERGAGPARNKAASHAVGKLLAFTDSDCLPSPSWLANGLKSLEPNRIVGGAMRVSVADESCLSGAEAFERVFAFNNERYVKELGFTVTANLFCTREDFQKIGPFRTEVSEDKDWCDRARGLGLEVLYAEDAVVVHPARRNWDALKAKWLRLDYETYNLLKAQGGSDLTWFAQAWALPVSIIPHGLRCLRSDRLKTSRDRLKAAQTLALIRLWRFIDYHRLLFK